MNKSFIQRFLFAVLMAVVFVVLAVPFPHHIDCRKFNVMEYSLKDASYSQPHTVTLAGNFSYSLLQPYRFQGILSVSGIEETETASSCILRFYHGRALPCYEQPKANEAVHATTIAPIYCNADFSRFGFLIFEPDKDHSSADGVSYQCDGHFIAYPGQTREAAIRTARQLKFGEVICAVDATK